MPPTLHLELCEVGFWVVVESSWEKYLSYYRLCWVAAFSLTPRDRVALLRSLRKLLKPPSNSSFTVPVGLLRCLGGLWAINPYNTKKAAVRSRLSK